MVQRGLEVVGEEGREKGGVVEKELRWRVEEVTREVAGLVEEEGWELGVDEQLRLREEQRLSKR